MTTILARNAEMLVTMDGERRELRNASLFARDGVIQQIGDAADLPQDADVVLDLAGQIILPGLINCHHHLDQTLTRNLPAGQNTNLFPWLRAHYRIWGSRTPEESGLKLAKSPVPPREMPATYFIRNVHGVRDWEMFLG